MNPSFKQSIASVVMSAVATTISTVQAKHNDKILFLHEMIEKSLLPRDFSFATLLPDPNTTTKVSPPTNSLLKTSTKR